MKKEPFGKDVIGGGGGGTKKRVTNGDMGKGSMLKW